MGPIYSNDAGGEYDDDKWNLIYLLSVHYCFIVSLGAFSFKWKNEENGIDDVIFFDDNFLV